MTCLLYLAGPLLRHAREHAQLSQADAAARLNVPLRTYQSWETDDPPTPWPRHRLVLEEFVSGLLEEVAA